MLRGASIAARDADARTPLAHAQYEVDTMGLACPCMEEPLQVNAKALSMPFRLLPLTPIDSHCLASPYAAASREGRA